ncbi:MAG: hypothetical protein WCI48_12220 [Bacteroidota bacterium]
MKTNVFYILMTIIVMGMVVPAFAGYPEKKQGDKTKTDNLLPLPLSPLTTWNLYIVPTDAADSCTDYNSTNPCDLFFHVESATDGCIGSITNPQSFDVQITWGTRSYGPYQISTDAPCVKVTVISKASPVCTNINTTPCCTCPHGQSSATCYIKICP